MPSPFTLNPQGFSKNAFTLDVNFLTFSQPSNSRKEGGTWAGGGKWKKIGDRVQPLSDTWSARAKKGRQILNSESVFEVPLSDEVIRSSSRTAPRCLFPLLAS
ncbi:hypothetical protein C0033_17810 [Clostridium sp. chh4-2]|nr:hypothetical protein C0033_17810 [Clostridium sp. chh4-2]